MLSLPRSFTRSIPVVALLALAGAQPASAEVATASAARVSSTTVVFKLHKVEPSAIRSATVRLGARKHGVPVKKVRRAARSHRLAVRLPKTWRRDMKIRRPKLVVKTASASARPTGKRAPAAVISGQAYYVSPSGSDSNAGTSPQSPWRTVGRANRATLNAGDGVLFQGGATFSDDALMPEDSGSAQAPLVFGSYGTGQATFTKGAWFSEKSWLTFDNLHFVSEGVSGSQNGAGTSHIMVQNSSFEHMDIAAIAPNHGDKDWTLRSNYVNGTADSGFIVLGDHHTVADNTILNTGTDRSIDYGKHGVYLKSSNSRVTGNTIRGFEADGVSARYRNSVIENNTISGGQIGIGWFQADSGSGTSRWLNNTISATTAACIYVSPSDAGGSTRESFVISKNRLSRTSGNFTDFQHTSGTYSVAANSQN